MKYRKEIIAHIGFYRLFACDLISGKQGINFTSWPLCSNEKYTNIAMGGKIPLIFYVSGI
jgi:hypothetical protein